MQSGRLLGHDPGGLREFFRRLQFTVGGDDPGPSLTLRLGLPRYRPLHGIGQHDILDFHAIDVNPPSQRRAVDE